MEHFQAYRSFVSYIDRTREYYAAQGYTKPYTWPRYDDVPFSSLPKPLAGCRVGLVTTAGKPEAEVKTDLLGLGLGVRALYAESTEPRPTHLFTDDLGWDKETTHTEDIDSFLPLNRLFEYAACGRIGSVSPDYSKSRTITYYAPQLFKWCKEDAVDALLLSAL
jgi:hypothetical protein